MTLPAPGFPAATYTTDSNTPATPSGTSTWLGPATPFGAFFGSSQNSPYLFIRNTTAGAPSTTTFTFAAPTPTPTPEWGFALGDVDADMVAITASGPGGPLSAADLGWQGAFNYCGTPPAPSACTKAPFTDVPTWNPATSTLIGNVNDTDGAAGWFRPTAPITELTFTFTRQSGIPIYQLWFAALPVAPVPPPPATTIPDPPPDTTTTTTQPSTTVAPTTTAPALAKPPTTPPPPPPPPPPTTTTGPRLAETGSSTSGQLGVALVLLSAGVVLIGVARRIRPRHLER